MQSRSIAVARAAMARLSSEPTPQQTAATAGRLRRHPAPQRTATPAGRLRRHPTLQQSEAAARFVSSIPAITGKHPHARAVLQDPTGFAALARVILTLPRTDVRLTDDPCCRGLRRRLARTTLGVKTELLAPAVILLPGTLASYLRGRHRQAVRTALHHSDHKGMTTTFVPHAEREAVLAELVFARTHLELNKDEWQPRLEPETQWIVSRSSDGTLLVLCVVLACAHAARLELHMSAFDPPTPDISDARYATHTAAVGAAIAKGSPLLIVDSPLGLGPGLRHFQRRLGYEPRRLRLRQQPFRASRDAQHMCR